MSLEAVDVQMGWSQGTYSITSSLVMSADGISPTSSQYSLDPSMQDKLPVRVRLSYQAGDQSGTDLASLKGYTGQVVIRLSVENVTVKASELSFEVNGAKYRRYGLVGAPYTVVAWATTAAGTLGQVVSVGTDQPLTNGVISQVDGDGARVLWTAMLAPPVESPTAVFTLAMDVTNFDPPQFDVVVQPGLVTDMSPTAMLAGDQDTNAQAVQLMSQVQQEVARTSQLVGDVQKSLSTDAEQIGTRTYSELSSSATTTLAEIDSLAASMKSISAQAASSITGATSAMNSTLVDLFNHISADVLGNPSKPVLITGAAIDGCNITLPRLDAGQPKTVAATLQLVSQQTSTLADAFAAQAGSPVTPNCRAALIEAVRTSIGDTSIGCTAAEGQADSVVCAIAGVKDTLSDEQANVLSKQDAVDAQMGYFNGQALLQAASTVRSQLNSLIHAVSNDPGDVTPTLKQAQGALDDAQQVLTDATTRLNSIASIAADHTGADQLGLDALVAQVIAVADQAGCQDVSGLNDQNAMDALAADTSCTVQIQTLAATVATSLRAAIQDKADWKTVSDLADYSGFQTSNGASYDAVAGSAGKISQAITALNNKITELAQVYQPGDYLKKLLLPQLDTLYSGQVLLANNPASACAAVSSTPTLDSPTSTDTLFDAVNNWVCNYQTLSTSIDAWKAAIQTGDDHMSNRLSQADTSAEHALTQAEQNISDVSQQMNSSLTNQAVQAIADAQSSLTQSLSDLDQARQATSAQLATQMAAIVTALNAQVGSSVLSAESTKQSLQADFKALLIDLGNPASQAPTGLIGKLRSTSDVTQSATDQLVTLSNIVQGSIDAQSLAGQALALQSEQLAVGQQMLADTPFLCGQPKPDGGTTIYTIHVGADLI